MNLVEVYATVTDRAGEPVTGLAQSDFTVLEDGAARAITAFAAGEFPLAVAIGLDRSFSMGGRDNRLAVVKSAARTLVGALRPDDQVMIVAIGSDTAVAAPLSADHAAALAAIDRLDAWGTTPLYDATLGALDAIQPARGRRALVLLSDGNDRYSSATAAEALERARRADVMIYPVALGSARPPLFAELSSVTGGRSFLASDPKTLPDTLRRIARELRQQYLLGYTPTRPPVPGSGEWRSITVRVKRADVHVHARDGYLVK